MSAQIIPVDPFDYVVFGGTGDLAERKLLPALYLRMKDEQFSAPSRIIGASRSAMSTQEYQAFAKQALAKFVDISYQDNEAIAAFLECLDYVQVDAKSDAGWAELEALLANNNNQIAAYYLAVGPSLFGDIAERLHRFNMVHDNARIVVEKPIGRDLKSAQALNDDIGRYFKEEQVFRIDHYLGKETVQNLMALRFANALFEPLWNSAHIDHVQITVAESIGVGGRGDYYNRAGAMRDMVQNHLLQLLCLVAMEPPASDDADAVRDEKLKILRALKPIDSNNFEQMTVRGQYVAGASSSEGAVPSYIDEITDEQSTTETFVAIKTEIENWRWAGVPFYLRTGKRMPMRASEIVITFKPIPHSIFDKNAGKPISNRLVIRLQPNEGVKQWIMIKDPGPGGMRLRHVPLDMSFADSFEMRAPDAYERLLMDVIRGNQTLFMRRDEVVAAWKWVDPILEAWVESATSPNQYTSGTAGPASAIALIERDGRSWHDVSEF
jgi:glucose-6-phosphate 1-dehydrogenase